jgi:glycosyltransferase involved in cell wall biosynthesis
MPAARRLTRWRNAAIEERAARDIRAGLAGGAFAVQGFPAPSLAASRARGLPGFVFAAMDIWAVNRALVRESCSQSQPADRREALRERDLVFEGDSTLAVANASHALVESERMAARVREIAGYPMPATVVGYGVDLPTRLRERDTDARPLRVMTAARVGYAKGIHHLDAAIREAPVAIASAVVAGSGIEYVPALVQRCTPSLTFVGHQPRTELLRMYHDADVFVLPTLADAMARTVLEAMANGLPVIVTTESGYDGIIEDGVQGFVVPPGCPAAIASKLTLLAADGELRSRMGRAARALAEGFSWPAFEERVRTRFVPVVAEALEKGRTHREPATSAQLSSATPHVEARTR